VVRRSDTLQGDALLNNGSLTAGHALDLDKSPGAGYGLVHTSVTRRTSLSPSAGVLRAFHSFWHPVEGAPTSA
jgi:hypothetical protein